MLLLNIREVSRDISVHMCAVCDPEVSTVTFCLFNLVLIFILHFNTRVCVTPEKNRLRSS